MMMLKLKLMKFAFSAYRVHLGSNFLSFNLIFKKKKKRNGPKCKHVNNYMQLQSSIELSVFNIVNLNKKGSIVTCKVEVREEEWRKQTFSLEQRKVPMQYKVIKITVRDNVSVNTMAEQLKKTVTPV